MAKTPAKHPIFALRLAQARERLGLTQTQLGISAGIDPTVASPRINQYEKGKNEPRSATTKRLAKVLGVPPAFLYTEDEVLAKLLLRWLDLPVTQRKQLLKQAEDLLAPKSKTAKRSRPAK